MTAARYFDLLREMKESIYNDRLRLVESAKERGIKPTARLFATTVPTVRKWLRRYQRASKPEAPCCWAFAEGRSAAASAVFASRIQQHLDRYGISLRDPVWQTDNGGEFKGDFPKALGDSQHVRIPPAAHTYQSDVETVHRLAEDEFFDLEDFFQPRRFPGQSAHLPALLQPRPSQLAQAISESLANHRAPRPAFAPPDLLALTCLSGLPPLRLRGTRCA